MEAVASLVRILFPPFISKGFGWGTLPLRDLQCPQTQVGKVTAQWARAHMPGPGHTVEFSRCCLTRAPFRMQRGEVIDLGGGGGITQNGSGFRIRKRTVPSLGQSARLRAPGVSLCPTPAVCCGRHLGPWVRWGVSTELVSIFGCEQVSGKPRAAIVFGAPVKTEVCS